MSPGNGTGWSGAASVLLRSYVADLAGIAVGYAIGVALVVGGVLMVLVGVAVGVVALYHFIELRVGPELAYTIVDGGFLVLGSILLLAGTAVKRRRLPSPSVGAAAGGRGKAGDHPSRGDAAGSRC